MTDEADLELDDGLFPGVWANHVLIDVGQDDFVLDFVWVDRRDRRGLTVARVVLSPRLMRHLLDDGSRSWQTWSDRQLPPEVRGDDR